MSEAQKETMMNKASIAAIIALLSWNIFTTHQLSISLAVVSEKVSQIEKLMDN